MALHACVCCVFYHICPCLFSPTTEASLLGLPVQYIPPLSRPRLDSDGAVIYDKQTEGKEGEMEAGAEVATSISSPLGFVCLL